MRCERPISAYQASIQTEHRVRRHHPWGERNVGQPVASSEQAGRHGRGGHMRRFRMELILVGLLAGVHAGCRRGDLPETEPSVDPTAGPAGFMPPPTMAVLEVLP